MALRNCARDAMDRRVFYSLLAFSSLGLFLYVLYLLLAPFLVPLGWAAVVAIATYPLFGFLDRRLGWSRNALSLLTTAVVFLVVVVPALLIGLMLVQEIVHAQEYINSFSAEERKAAFDRLVNAPWVGALIHRANELAASFNVDIKEMLVQGGRQLLSLLAGSLTGAAKQAAVFVFELALVLVALFFFYRDGRTLTEAFWGVLPIPQERKRVMHDTVENVVSAVVVGVLVTAIVQGALAGLGYWVAGVGSPVLLGTLTAIAALIPVVGTMLVWIPAVGFLLVSGHVAEGIGLAVWCAAVVGSADNFLRPLLISGRTGLPFALMTLGALGGLAAFGFFGLVAGPLILAVFLIAYEMYRQDVIELPGAPRGMLPDPDQK